MVGLYAPVGDSTVVIGGNATVGPVRASLVPRAERGKKKGPSFHCFYQPAARKARSRLVLRLLCCFCVCIYMCVRTYHVRNNYVTYIVAMRPYFS